MFRSSGDIAKSLLEAMLTLGSLLGVVVSLLQPEYASVLGGNYYSVFSFLYVLFIIFALLAYGSVLTGDTYQIRYKRAATTTAQLFAGLVAFALFPSIVELIGRSARWALAFSDWTS